MSKIPIKGVKTIAQYKIMEYIYDNFVPETIDCELINSVCVKVTDSKQDSLYFYYQDEQVQFGDTPIELQKPNNVKKVKIRSPKSPWGDFFVAKIQM